MVTRISYKFPQVLINALLLLLLPAMNQGCKKLVDVAPPPGALTSDNIYKSDATAISVLTGLYAGLSGSDLIGARSVNCISLVSALSADELSLFGGTANANTRLVQYYQNAVLPGTSSPSTNLWSSLYAPIYTVNLVIENLNGSTTLSPAVKKQLLGEAKFLRGFYYFYLVNLFGDVPLPVTSDYRVVATLPRAPKVDVYNQIVNDLKEAQNLLADNYVEGDAKTTTTERVRPNKWAATALLARTYLYTSNWTQAEIQASSIIGNTAMYDTVSLNSVFLRNSKEAIWQVQPVNLGWNTEEAKVFILPPTGPNTSGFGYPVYLSNQLLNAFETNDKRKSNWVGGVNIGSGAASTTYFYPKKYKSATLNAPVTEYVMMLRLGEQYLVRAEARAHLNKYSEAVKDLNIIRHRAGLPDASASDQNSLLNLIYHERQVELFTEWGHRWLDLKRTGKVDQVMGTYAAQKGASWSPDWALYPIPLYEIIQDPNLTQNSGY